MTSYSHDVISISVLSFGDQSMSTTHTIMSSKVDPAILKALSLDPSSATISKHGGGGFAKTFRISGTVDGRQKLFFVKTGEKDSEEMFTGMYENSLLCFCSLCQTS